MAFWGIEVKPGKPFTHKFDDSRGRLHLSMASLGMGKATAKSILQCNVGNKSPVFLCSLFPEKAESLQLNLEFEEVDEVIFSVIGPRSIHLSGYYLGGGGGRFHALNEESESYGEDIADTDTQRSDCSDEEYDDSFIDDGEPEVFSSSPVSSGGESLDSKKLKNGGGNNRRRLRKKYQLSDSDDEECSQPKNTANGNSAILGLESEDEDNIPISACLKVEITTKKGIQDGEENVDTGVDEGGLPMRMSNWSVDKLSPSEVSHKDGGTPKKKRKEQSTEDKSHESDGVKEDKTQNGEAKDGEKQKMANDRKSNRYVDKLLPSEVGQEDGGTAKKKRKERSTEDGSRKSDRIKEDKTQNGEPKDGEKQKMVNDSDLAHEIDERPKKKKRKDLKNEKKNLEIENSHLMNDLQEEKDRQDEAKDASIDQDPSMRSEQIQKLANDPNQSEEKKVKKKKKRSKAQEKGETVNADTPLELVDGKNTSSTDLESKKPDSKRPQVRTLQNGLVIEELESGKQDGKVTCSGKKISIHYIIKLKKNGEVVDSNINGDPYKFRLGAGVVPEGLEVGLEGMRVGEKRRLIVPPSLGYGKKGNGEKIPPNSWLVYEVELVKVR